MAVKRGIRKGTGKKKGDKPVTEPERQCSSNPSKAKRLDFSKKRRGGNLVQKRQGIGRNHPKGIPTKKSSDPKDQLDGSFRQPKRTSKREKYFRNLCQELEILR